jgi:hypothetical protein
MEDWELKWSGGSDDNNGGANCWTVQNMGQD